MTVKRKLLVQKEKPEKLIEGPPVRKVPRSVKVDQLPDAIVDGKWTCNPEDEVVVMVKRGGRVAPVRHTFKKMTDDLVELWDEEQHRWFSFKVPDAVKVGLPVKILFRAAQPPAQ